MLNGKEVEALPVSIPPPAFVTVKVRSAVLPTATFPNPWELGVTAMTEAMVFRKTETVLALTLATARSRCPFPLRSPIATENGPVPGPVAKSDYAAKRPAQFPGRTECDLK